MNKKISFKLNGRTVAVETDPSRKLLWVLRVDLGLTGTKYGCGESYCGSCTVVVNGAAERSCQLTLGDVENKEVITIEGLLNGEEPHPLQKAFIEYDALQCGYCTPGMIMNAYSLLKKNPNPTVAEIKAGMEDNFCRCGAHKRIIEAVQKAAVYMKGGK